MRKYKINEKGQAVPCAVLPIPREAFSPMARTEIRWLGGAGVMLNIRGTVILVDPVLRGFDMPLLFDMPLQPEDIPHADAVLVTHIDNDHFSRETIKAFAPACGTFHATQYVAEEMRAAGISGTGHDIHEGFHVGDVHITLTPAKHNWQNGVPEFQYRVWKEEDYCGYWFDTPDGTVWLPGDSRLLPEHLSMPSPDVILFDFSDNDWHITLAGAIRLANAYPQAKLICIHWGTVDAPDMTPFNGNPDALYDAVVNPQRILPLCPGEAFTLRQ